MVLNTTKWVLLITDSNYCWKKGLINNCPKICFQIIVWRHFIPPTPFLFNEICLNHGHCITNGLILSADDRYYMWYGANNMICIAVHCYHTKWKISYFKSNLGLRQIENRQAHQVKNNNTIKFCIFFLNFCNRIP